MSAVIDIRAATEYKYPVGDKAASFTAAPHRGAQRAVTSPREEKRPAGTTLGSEPRGLARGNMQRPDQLGESDA